MADRFVPRLRTGNFTRVVSRAVTSIDYDAKARIIEIEYTTGEIYHYHNARKTEWIKMLALAVEEKGLGAYVNQVFKRHYTNGGRKYYRLNLPGGDD